MKTTLFDYELPEELIAQTPIYPRDSSRLLIYDRKNDKTEHKHFFDIKDYLKNGDVLVINNTKVLPARLFGVKEKTGGKVELLLLKRIDLTTWEVILKPCRSAKIGTVYDFNGILKGEIIDRDEEGNFKIKFIYQGVFEDILNNIGQMPLPPYIKQKLEDKERYNTVYCKTEGSAAAPTAGLHFTPQLLQQLKDKGVIITEVLLHVGLGTFRPVKVDEINLHHMHSEYYCVNKETAALINTAKEQGRRIIAVGTTSVRVLESASDEKGVLQAKSGFTDIFIYPPYKFKIVNALITNFHLPKSTLLMLVSAFCTREKVLELYNKAVEERYRFFSFGDAMLII